MTDPSLLLPGITKLALVNATVYLGSRASLRVNQSVLRISDRASILTPSSLVSTDLCALGIYMEHFLAARLADVFRIYLSRVSDVWRYLSLSNAASMPVNRNMYLHMTVEDR